MKAASVCTGAGLLDLAVLATFPDAHMIWHAEIDKAASKVLAHRWPGVPNHGDLTTFDWAGAEQPDILTGGWPCQPWSAAGQRKGADDDRAIWPAVADAIRLVRPRLLLLENVSRIVAAGELERAVGDLARLGYVGSWRSLRASDVGAPHRRERCFIVAWRADAAPPAPGVGPAGRLDGAGPADLTLLPTPRASDTNGVGQHGVGGMDPRTAVALLKTPTAQLAVNGGSQHPDKRRMGGHGPTLADEVEHLLPTPAAARSGRNRSPSPGAAIPPSLDMVHALLPTPRASDGAKGGPNQRGSKGDLTLPAAAMQLLPTPDATHGRKTTRTGPLLAGAVELLPTPVAFAYADRFGRYGAAIARWEAVTGIPAPDPTEPGRNGPRLSPRFAEWMMGAPPGWVTDVVGRSDALRIIGNGVVWQQAAAALRWALSRQAVAA